MMAVSDDRARPAGEDTGDPAAMLPALRDRLERLPMSRRELPLAAWREREADRLDLARPFLLRDETMLALAKRDALAPADAPALPGYDQRRHSHQVSRWVAALQAARAEAAAGTAPSDVALAAGTFPASSHNRNRQCCSTGS